MSNIISSLIHNLRCHFLLVQNADGSRSGFRIHKPAAMTFFRPKTLRVAFSSLLALAIIVVFLRPPFGGSVYYRKPRPEALEGIDWSRFAYVQYATNTEYLCNSVMLFEALHRLGSKADRLLMHPSDFTTGSEDGSKERALLQKAQDAYGVTLTSIEIQRKRGRAG